MLFRKDLNPLKDCDYIVFDLETSSLNSRTTEIVEVSAIKICDSEIIDSFSSLVRPTRGIDDAAIEINNINIDDLLAAEEHHVVIPAFLDFISDSKLVGYNISSFDLPILKRYANHYGFQLKNNHEDIFYLAKQKLPNLTNHRLATVASYFMLDTTGVHRALADCVLTYKVMTNLLPLKDSEPRSFQGKKYHSNYSNQTKALQELQALISGAIADNQLTRDEIIKLSSWLSKNENLAGNYPYDRIAVVVRESLQDGVLEDCELEEMLCLFKEYTSDAKCNEAESLDLYEKTFVLTGDFSRGSKDYIKQIIESINGTVKNSVSKKIDFVVMGSKGSPDWSYGNYGTKVKRAKELQSEGINIRIISENDFFDSLPNNL